MKTLKTLILTMFITLAPFQQTKAVVGLFTMNGPLLLKGLGLSTGSVMIVATSNCLWRPSKSCKILDLTFIAGAVMLNKQSKKIEFSKLNKSFAQKIKITERERLIYNDEVENLNLIIEEVSTQLSESSSEQDSKELWDNYLEMLSPETVKTLKMVISQKN